MIRNDLLGARMTMKWYQETKDLEITSVSFIRYEVKEIGQPTKTLYYLDLENRLFKNVFLC